jgi:diacylglycerol kinase (ATP)
MQKRVFIIVNPASGQEEPILSFLNKALEKSGLYWEIEITRKKSDAYNFTKKALARNFDLITVYGGDGTVMEAAQALYKNRTPLLILPGGTANVMAKEIGIPPSSREAVNLLRSKFKTKTIDMALLDKKPFMLRISAGILADIVRNTAKDSKEKFGTLAYSVSALKKLIKHDIYSYDMKIDGKKVSESGIALMVANAGNIGISGFSVLPHIKVADGFLDVVIFKSATATSFYSLIKSMYTGKKPQGEVKHWRAKEVVINLSPPAPIVCDDLPLGAQTIRAKIAPKSLNVVVP